MDVRASDGHENIYGASWIQQTVCLCVCGGGVLMDKINVICW